MRLPRQCLQRDKPQTSSCPLTYTARCSESACYQTGGRYAHWLSAEGPLQLLLCKTALGAVQDLGCSVTAQTKEMVMPGERGRVPGCGVIRYDSVRAGPHRPFLSGPGTNDSIIYVVYKTEQVFPEYVVTYKMDGGEEGAGASA